MYTHTKFRVLLLCIIIFLVMPGVFAAQAANVSLDGFLRADGYQAIPTEIKNGFLCMKISIKNHPAVAIIDTGSSGFSVTKSTAEKLKLVVYSLKRKGANMYGGKFSVGSVAVPSVSISGMQLKNITADILQRVSSGNGLTLVLGREFLKRYHAVIDLANEKIYLSSNPLSRSEMDQLQGVLVGQTFQSVPLMFLASGSIIIPLQIDQASPVSFLFDTGTGITLLSKEYATALRLQQDEKASTAQIEVLTLNPLNVAFQPTVVLKNVSVQLDNLTMLKKYLYVQGIFGLPDMIKARAIIFFNEGAVFFRSCHARVCGESHMVGSMV